MYVSEVKNGRWKDWTNFEFNDYKTIFETNNIEIHHLEIYTILLKYFLATQDRKKKYYVMSRAAELGF